MQRQGCCQQQAHVEARKRTSSSPQGRVSTQFWRGDSSGDSQRSAARGQAYHQNSYSLQHNYIDIPQTRYDAD
jgi:hypothetical protein